MSAAGSALGGPVAPPAPAPVPVDAIQPPDLGAPAVPTHIPVSPAGRNQLPLPPISMLEGLLVEIGIDALISREVEKIGAGRLRQAAKMPDEIRTLSRKLVRGELEPSIGLRDFSWRKAVTELAAGWEVDQVVSMLKSFPPEYQAAASALVIKSVKLIKELASGLPLTRYQTLAGSKNLIPADAHIFKFASVLEVIRDPLIVFPLMAGGALLKLQANAVRETYPTISAAIDMALVQATFVAKANKKSFELPPRVEYGVRNWMGKSPIEAGALQQSQKNVSAMNEKKANPAPPPSKPPVGLLTAAQRAESKGSPTP
jgi:hypothetical protein